MQDWFTEAKWHGMVVPTKLQNLYPHLIIGFTTKNGGVSEGSYCSLNVGLHVGDDRTAVCENRQRVAEQLGIPIDKWVMLEQVHGAHIERVTAEQTEAKRDVQQPIFSACDGIYTRDKGVLLVTFYADCTPVYFFAPKQGLIGLAHSGWKGTAAEIAPRMLRIWLEKEGVSLSEIQVGIGPSIGACCYAVSEQVADSVAKTIDEPYKNDILFEKKDRQYHLDLKRTIYFQMKKMGLEDSQIHCTAQCTACLNERYFSYRRDGGQTGRMMGFIGLKEDWA